MQKGIPYNTDYVRKRIELLLEHKGASARSMSISIGKSETYISNVLLGRCQPTYDTFLSICSYFNISPSQFFDDGLSYPIEYHELADTIFTLLDGNIDMFRSLIAVIRTLSKADAEAIIGTFNKFHNVKLGKIT